MNADQYTDKLDSPLKEIVTELRHIITNHSSDVKEGMKWNVPTYSAGSNICSIMAHKKHVNLQIFRGAQIKDAQELEGTGENMRHLKFSTMSDVRNCEVEKYLKQAIELDK